MEFDFDKRVRFASTVYVEGVNAEVPDRLTGIDKDGVRTSFAANAVEAGNAVLLYEIENDFGVFDDEWYAADEEFGEEIKASCAAYAVFAEEDNREGYAYIIDAAADLAFVNRDGVTEQMPIADFRAAAWRVDAAGTPVIAFAANLEAQYKTCKDLGLASHVVEIDDMFERLKQSDLAGDQMRPGKTARRSRDLRRNLRARLSRKSHAAS
jgi:hypothetical protein